MNLWAALYLATHALLAVGLAGRLLALPRALPAPRLARFFAGLSLAPFASGGWVMLWAALWPGMPRGALVVGLMASALLLCASAARSLPRQVMRAWRRLPPMPGGALTIALVYGALLIALALLGVRLWRNALQPVVAHDALNYLNEALYFLDQRSLSGMLDMRDAADGSVRGTTHGFLFTALLAGALLFTDGAPGFANDLAARLAVQLTVPAMLCGVLALCGVLRRRGAGALAVLMVLGVAQFEYISHAASRDGFRIVPLLLLVLVLSTLGAQRVRLVTLALVAGAAALAFTAHTLNVMVIATVTAMWCVVARWQRRGLTQMLIVSAAVGVGIAAMSGRYVASFLASGQLWGELPARYGLAGSALDGAWQHLARYADSHALGAGDKIMVVLARDGGLLSGVGLVAAAALLVLNARANGRPAERLWALSCLALIVPLSGLFDWEPYRISDWFVENLRYGLHWYPLLAVTLVACVVHGGESCAGRGRRAARGAVVVVLVVAVGYGALAVHTLSERWRGDAARAGSRRALASNLELLTTLSRHLAPGQRLCLDDFGYGYYLGNHALILGAKLSWPLLRAADAAQAAATLDSLAVGAVVLRKASIPNWFERLPLYHTLSASDTWQVAGETRLLIAYQRRPPAVEARAPRAASSR